LRQIEHADAGEAVRRDGVDIHCGAPSGMDTAR
jgi:hypothetical protein